MDTNIILTMVMIILVIIINVVVSKYISNRIDPQKKIDQLNQQIDQLNIVTDSMNEYLKTEIEKQTQKVIDVKKDSEQEQQDGEVNTNTDNINTDDTNTNNTITNNTTSANDQPTNGQSPMSNNIENTSAENTVTENDITSENVIMEEDKEPTKISDSQTNNVNCFVRTITVNNINMFNNGSIGQSTIQTIIEKFVNTFEKNFKDLNLLPIGSIIYSIIPVHTNNDVFIYGQYYLQSLINSNTTMDTIYNYQLQLPDDWSKGSGFRFPNMKDRALQGKTKINYSLVESEYKNNVDRSINVTENVKAYTHTELEMVDFIQNDATTETIQKGVIRKADFITNPSKNSTLTHGKQVSEVIFTPKVQDQQTKLFFYVVLGYTSSNTL